MPSTDSKILAVSTYWCLCVPTCILCLWTLIENRSSVFGMCMFKCQSGKVCYMISISVPHFLSISIPSSLSVLHTNKVSLYIKDIKKKINSKMQTSIEVLADKPVWFRQESSTQLALRMNPVSSTLAGDACQLIPGLADPSRSWRLHQQICF